MAPQSSLADFSFEEKNRLLTFDSNWLPSQLPQLHLHIRENDEARFILELIRIDVERRQSQQLKTCLSDYLLILPEVLKSQAIEKCITAIVARHQAIGIVQLNSRYSELLQHAHGGLGQVFQARDETLDRTVAMKVLHQKWCGVEQAKSEFAQEARISCLLEHPGIAPVYQMGHTQDGRPCYSMRFIQGQTFRQASEAYHQLPVADRSHRSLVFRRLLQHFVTVCHTIAYAHSKGVLHRDIKPDNIMLGSYGETFVVDWGMSYSPDQENKGNEIPPVVQKKSHVPVQIKGTPGFMSPEQAAGDCKLLSSASDIFSLGATLYSLLTNRPPYENISKLIVINQAILHHFPFPSQVVSQIPRALESVCLKAMAKQPADRYPSASDLAQEIDNYLADEPVQAWKEPWWIKAKRTVRRRQLLFGMTAALLFIVPLAATVGAWLISLEQTKTLLSEQRAQFKERSATQLTEYLTRIFESADPLSLSATGLQGDDALAQINTATAFLERGRELVKEHLKDQPLTRARLLLAMSRTYHSLGLMDEANSLANECYQVHLSQLGRIHADTLSTLQLLGVIAQSMGEYQKAEEILLEVLQLRRQLFGNNHAEVAETMYSLGMLSFYRPFGALRPQFVAENRKQAEDYFIEALRIRKTFTVVPHTDIGIILASLASLKLSEPGQEFKAILYMNEAATHFAQSKSTNPMGSVLALMIRAETLRKNMQYQEADKVYVETITLLRKHLGKKHPMTILQMANRIGMVKKTGDFDRALTLARELQEIIRPIHYFRSQPMFVEGMIHFCDELMIRKKNSEASDGYHEAMKFALERPNDNQKNIAELTMRFRANGWPIPTR